MAINSLSMGFISRSEGRSSVGFGAYISGATGYDQRTGISYNYSNKKEVVSSKILSPTGAPEWALNAHTLWNHVEKFEDELAAMRFQGDSQNEDKNARSIAAREKMRENARTSQTIMCALPLELTDEQNEALIEAFLKARFVSRGLVVQYAYHGDQGNPHMHAQITRRAVVEGKLSVRTDREITTKRELFVTRKMWAEITNKHLALAGHEVRIDHRSLEDQGSMFIPMVHKGWHAQRLAERGEYSRIVEQNLETRQRNIEIMCEHPEALIHAVALKRTTFTRKHIEDEIIRRVGGDEKLFALLKARVNGIEIPSELILKQINDDVVYEGFGTDMQRIAAKLTDQLLCDESVSHKVGANINRDIIYTSTTYKNQEESLLQMADMLHAKTTKVMSSEGIALGIKRLEIQTSIKNESTFKFFDEQVNAIHHLCSGSDIRVLNGKAGTGKTTLLKAVAEIYHDAGYRVLGTSFQGKAVEIMEEEIGIPCRTLDSYLYVWKKQDEQISRVNSGQLWGIPYIYTFNRMKELESHRFTSNDVVILDEANMIGGHLWEPFLKEATSRGAKVLVVQDPAQIKSRDPGDYGRLFAERYGFAETRMVVRQRVEWQRESSALLNEHRVLDGLQPYHDRGHIHWFESVGDLQDQLVKDYLTHLKTEPSKTRMVLAYRNRDVYELNQVIRAELKTQGLLKDHFLVGGSEYSIGDVIRFTENDNHGRFVKNLEHSENCQGIKNGSLGTIQAYDGKSQLQVKLTNGRQVQFNTQEYKEFSLGYAMTVHKSEGSTFDQTYLLPDRLMDPSTSLVLMTRHRDDVQMYINREQFVDFKDLVDAMSQGKMRETLGDYNLSDTQRPFFENVQKFKDLIADAASLRDQMEAELKPTEPLYKHPAFNAYQLHFEQKKEVAEVILGDWQQHLPYVRLAGIRRDVLEVEAGVRMRLLSDLEYRASIQVQGYTDLVRETRDLWGKITSSHPGTLAQHHELYGEYKALKVERDSLASVFDENPKLYSSFFKYTQDNKDFWGNSIEEGNKVYFSGVKAHAQAHVKDQRQQIYHEKLSPEQRVHFDVVKSYIQARNEAATIYSHLKKQETNAVTLSSQTLMTQERFKVAQATRDGLALKIIETTEGCQPHIDFLKVSEDKLLDHAILGEARSLVRLYQSSESIGDRAHTAEQLLVRMANSSCKQIIKEAGVDFNRLTFDVAFHIGVQDGLIEPNTYPDDVYKPIKNYLEPARSVAKLWNLVQAQSKEALPEATPMERMNQSEMKQEWLCLIKARNENAHLLLQNKPAMMVMMAMKPETEKRLYDQAAKVVPQARLSSVSISHQGRNYIPVDAVLESAKGRYMDLVPRIMNRAPDVRESNKSTLSFGSLKFTMTGSKAGLWHDFATSKGGSIIHLVQQEKGLDFKGALEYLSQELNVRNYDQIYVAPAKSVQDSSAEETADKASRLKSVAELYAKSRPIKNTVAETYLRDERGIKSALSDDLRFLPKGTQFTYGGKVRTLNQISFAAFGRQANGELSVVQLTSLNIYGERAKALDGEKLKKIQYGVSKGAFVTIQSSSSQDSMNRVFIAEGLETALSIKETGVSGRIVAGLGINNLGNYIGQEKAIILCADNDEHKPTSQTYKLIEKAADGFKSNGHAVDIIKPTTPGHDFNDVLKEQGVKGVGEYLKPYLDYKNHESLEINYLSDASKAASHFETLINKIEEAYSFRTKAELRHQLADDMELLSKNPIMIAEIKSINEPVGKQLEEIHVRQQQKQQARENGRGM